MAWCYLRRQESLGLNTGLAEKMTLDREMLVFVFFLTFHF